MEKNPNKIRIGELEEELDQKNTYIATLETQLAARDAELAQSRDAFSVMVAEHNSLCEGLNKIIDEHGGWEEGLDTYEAHFRKIITAANEAVRVLGEEKQELARQADELSKRAWELMIHHNGGSFTVGDSDRSEWATLTKSFIVQTEVVEQMTDQILVVNNTLARASVEKKTLDATPTPMIQGATKAAMLEYMKEATKLVASWPQWKRDVFRASAEKAGKAGATCVSCMGAGHMEGIKGNCPACKGTGIEKV